MGTQLNIKSEDAYRLATRLSELTGESLTTVVTKALRTELDREQRLRDKTVLRARLLAIADEISANMDPDTTSDHDWLYDDETGPSQVIVDASAILAIILREPDRLRFVDAMLQDSPRRMSVANWLEATMVVDRRGGPLSISRFEDFVRDAQIELTPVSLSQAVLARHAWRTFGRGVHPARLNYGDCFAYALAKETREPLLFKGNDFAQTDVEPALKD